MVSIQQPIQKIICTESAFQSGRCTFTWLPTGVSHRGLYILNFYGHVGAGPKNHKAYESNEEFLVSITNIQVLELLVDQKWADVDVLYVAESQVVFSQQRGEFWTVSIHLSWCATTVEIQSPELQSQRFAKAG